MIVTCEECSTRFNLDDTLIKDDGSKVRCSVCRHIFTVFTTPLKLEAESDFTPDVSIPPDTSIDTPSDTPIEAIDDTNFEETTDFEMEDNDFSLEDSELDFETPDLELDEDEDIAIDEPGDIKSGDFEPEDIGSDFEVEEDFSFGPALEDEEESELQLEDNSSEEDGTLDFDDAEPEEFDGIEFEPLDEDDTDFSVMQDDEPEFELEGSPGLELETEPELEDSALTDSVVDDEPDEFSAEDDFELDFDVSDDDQPKDDQTAVDQTKDRALEEDGLEIEIDTETDNDEMDLSLDESQKEKAPPPITIEDNFSEYDDVLEQETEPDVEPDIEYGEPETIEAENVKTNESTKTDMPEPEPETHTQRRHKKTKPLIGKPALVLIFLFLLVAGAYIASLMTGYKIPYLSDVKIPFIENLVKPKSIKIIDIKPVPNQKSVNGRFVTNSTVGTLFVITGTVENPSKITFSHIEIKGALITKGKIEAKTKTAFCGNIVTEEMLKTGNITDINKLLSVKQGHHNSNINIRPGATIPFMVVFSDLPEKLQNFTVKVINFTKVQNK
ncbi:MAG: zinc-ribbon domain-containing protein [Desulfobacula sp.]|nr:zinc-ribbon domain-containing protein [Desulfobacula sp.]